MNMAVDTGPELVIGLVGAIGVDLDAVASALRKAFERVNYHTRELRLIELLPPSLAAPAQVQLDRRYLERMKAGNRFRQQLQRNDALALLAMAAIRRERESHNGEVDRPIERCAYLLRSLKTPQEIERLRQVYGASCYVVSAYAPRDHRRDWLAQRIATSRHAQNSNLYHSQAAELIGQDEHERVPFGQNLRDTFPLGDVFLDVTARLDEQAQRFIEILFGHPFSTPTRDEHAMFLAFGAALRSSSAGRQVGAAIATRDGDIVAVGTNEVAKAFGGQYWGEDEHDHRDHLRHDDSNTSMFQNMLVDLLARLRKKGWLASKKKSLGIDELLALARSELLGPMEAAKDEPPSLAESARIGHVIEFIRAVHAEMAAFMSAARLGVPVDGCTLYSTSFPCHECARHIVASGIHRVVFIEPYPKSRVGTLYDDSICIDGSAPDRVPFQAFLGIAPRLYRRAFTMPVRKADDGRWIDWEKIRRRQSPRYYESSDAYIHKEENWIVRLQPILPLQVTHEAARPVLASENRRGRRSQGREQTPLATQRRSANRVASHKRAQAGRKRRPQKAQRSGRVAKGARR